MGRNFFFSSLFNAILLTTIVGHSSAEAPNLKVQHVNRLPNSHNPELLYWYISPSEMAGDTWKRQLNAIEDNGTFDFVYLTAREGANFYDFAKMKPFFQQIVREAHVHNMKVGLQLWTHENDVPSDQLEGIVVEQELTFDGSGHAEFTGESRGLRVHATKDGRVEALYPGIRSEVLGAYAFTKAAEGTYTAGSLSDVTTKVKVLHRTPESITASIDDVSLANRTLYVMTVHYHRFPDMFGSYIRESFQHALEIYKDAGFDGTALDEFRYMLKGRTGTQPFRERIYTLGMDRSFHERTGHDLKQTLFEMRYASPKDDAKRVRAINEYFDTLQSGPLGVEQFFHDQTEKILGPNAFHGIHDTFHNGLEADEVWSTGINWWMIPRVYGQSDEFTPMTTREGIAMAHPKPEEYNQYYNLDMHRLLDEGMTDARFNGRVHWHAMNDQHPWGLDIVRPDVLQGVSEVEDKVRLLNAFDAPRPQFNVLYLFGFPALLNWNQPDGERNEWDINGKLQAEEKAVLAWNAGYLGPFAPTKLLENGTIQVDGHGGMTFGGERFTSVVMIGPEFSKPETTKLLKKFVSTGGKLLLDGTQTMDFAGNDARQDFEELASHAVGQGVSESNLERLGVPKLAIDSGAIYTDGSVVLGDTDSLLNHKPVPFTIKAAGHTYTGTYEGLVALKSAPDGSVEKFVAGDLDSLKRDGIPVLTLNKRSDVVLRKSSKGYEVIIVGGATPELN